MNSFEAWNFQSPKRLVIFPKKLITLYRSGSQSLEIDEAFAVLAD